MRPKPALSTSEGHPPGFTVTSRFPTESLVLSYRSYSILEGTLKSIGSLKGEWLGN
jgi:hypothetical protein